MKKKFFVDTNVFLRVLVKEDKSVFGECKEFLEKIKRNEIRAVSANLVLAEVAWILKSYYGFSRKEVSRAVRGILNLNGVRWVDGYQALMAVDWYQNMKVKFIDAMLASIPGVVDGKWVMVSYDRDFDKLGVKRVEPAGV